MPTEIGSMYATIGAETGNFEAGMRRVHSGLGGVETKLGSAGGAVAGFWGHMASPAAGMAMTNVLGLVAQKVGDVQQAMIGGNAQFETYRTSFAVLLKGTDDFATGMGRAKERMAGLAQVGGTTPLAR